MTDESENGNSRDDRDMWQSRVQAPAAVFELLLAEHQKEMYEVVGKMMDGDMDDLESMLGDMMHAPEAQWYEKPLKTAEATIKKLAKGFALQPETLANFFNDDKCLGSDIRDALQNPDAVPARSANSGSAQSSLSARIFVQAVAEFLPEDIWKKNEELKEIRYALEFLQAAGLGTLGYVAPIDETTVLTSLYEAQKTARSLTVVADALTEGRKPNLAAIARCFARKGTAISDDIIARTEQSLKTKPPGPKPTFF
jgi:hypothetical protein